MDHSVELSPADLRSVCDLSQLKFKSTADLEPLDQVIGQQRAVQAINFGLNMHSPGYNIFVTGIEGTGKTTIVQDIVREHAKDLPTPCDYCMVNNFEDEFRPKAIAVPSGKAGLFSKQIHRLIENLKVKLPQAFEDSAFEKKKNDIQERYEAQEQAIFQKLEKSAAENQIAIHKSSSGIQPIPLKDGQPMTRETFGQLTEPERHKIDQNLQHMRTEIEGALRDIHKLRLALARDLEKLMAQVARFVVRDRVAAIQDEYKESSDIHDFLEAMQEDIVENVPLFFPAEESAPAGMDQLMSPARPSLQRYRVNVLVDRKNTTGAPVVFEPNPAFQNVFGWIEKRAQMGTVTTDFSMIRAGSLLQANGGFLIMEIESVLMDPMVWETLKRALQNKQLGIEEAPSSRGYATASLRPLPIALEVKVILIGNYEPFQLLQNYDTKFNKIFKVRADFDYEVPRSDETIHQYARFIARVCREEHLLHFTPAGVAAIVEFGEKYVAHQKKLSLRFGPIVGIIKEADYWARRQKQELVTDQNVYRAFNEHRFRYNLYEEKVHDAYLDKSILIDIDGEVAGQVNALAVFQMGDISFGRPSRITAETFMGKKGVINIEREARLSGKTHDKGVLILAGYLGRTFAQSQPLNLSVSITFEQSYAGIDGDSASSTELYAILSSLAGIPIRQGIAVTGSVNQKGQVQAIGGVNQKIEGFFDVCQSLELTGRQGVIIPRANKQNLMLKQEVIDAVAAGQFHIYAVATIEEGIEVLTGVPAGQRDDRGRFAEGTVFHKVQERLAHYLAESIKWRKTLDGIN